MIAAEGLPPLEPGTLCRLEFDTDTITIVALASGFHAHQQVTTLPYQDAGFLRIGGRGALTSTRGGGWIGGGFGLVGVVEGVLLSTALNALTRRTTSSMETILHLNAGARELMMLNQDETPQLLQVRLAPVFARLNSAKPEGRADRHEGPVRRIEELAALRDKGILSAHEFETTKAALLKTIADNVSREL